MLVNPQLIWFIFIPLYIALKIIYLIYKRTNGHEISLSHEIISSVFFLYMLALVSVTLFPIRINMLSNNVVSYNFIPFKSILHILKQGSHLILRNIAGNIIIFIPLGFLLPFILAKVDKIKKIGLFGFTISVIIELVQLTGIPERKTVDIDDLILNVAGTFIGFILYMAFCAVNAKFLKKNSI